MSFAQQHRPPVRPNCWSCGPPKVTVENAAPPAVTPTSTYKFIIDGEAFEFTGVNPATLHWKDFELEL